MRYPLLREAKKYADELLPTRLSVYKNGSPVYSDRRRVLLKKEHSLPAFGPGRCGVLPELGLVWHAAGKTLRLHSYEDGTTERIRGFSAPVVAVAVFAPQPGIFESRVCLCLLVLTETESFIYAVDGKSIVASDYSARLASPPCCVGVWDTRVYVGCANGRVYQLTYGCVEMIGYRHMAFTAPFSISGCLGGLFGGKPVPVLAMAVSDSHVVALVGTAAIHVYQTKGGLCRVKTIPVTDKYTAVQIIEDSPLFFSCVHLSGRRDFYGLGNPSKVISKELPVSEEFIRQPSNYNLINSSNFNTSNALNPNVCSQLNPNDSSHLCNHVLLFTTMDSLVLCKPGDSSHLLLVSFNGDQMRNPQASRPVENFESFVVHSPARAIHVHGNSIFVAADGKLAMFTLLDGPQLLLASTAHECWALLRNYGNIEFMRMYYELLASGNDVAKLDGLSRNESLNNAALFICIYNILKPIFTRDLFSLVTEASGRELDLVASKLRCLQARLKPVAVYASALELIDEILQSCSYAGILVSYGVSYSESLESLILDDSTFKTTSLTALLDSVSVNQSLEPLIKLMKNSCPSFLPLDQVNLQRGMDVLDKSSNSSLGASLEYFKNTKFDRAVIRRYNSIGYYTGSVTLIRDKFAFTHAEAVELLRDAVKCRGAVNAGLAASSEAFLYALFDVLCDVTGFEQCKCCDVFHASFELVKLTHPLFPQFLAEQAPRSIKIHSFYWKYLLYRGKKAEAAEAILGLCGSEIDFTEKMELLATAITVASAGGNSTMAQTRARAQLLLRLAGIQAELMARVPSARTNQLLGADSLYNDHCYAHPDLAIRVIDAVGFDDPKLLRTLYVKLFHGLTLAQCLDFLRGITHKSLGLVLDLLIDRLDQAQERREGFADFCEQLFRCGFNREEILKAVKEAADGPGHPVVARLLMNSLATFTTASELESPLMSEIVVDWKKKE